MKVTKRKLLSVDETSKTTLLKLTLLQVDYLEKLLKYWSEIVAPVSFSTWNQWA